MFVRTITSERLNVGRSSLAVTYAVQKSRPSSKVKIKGRRSRSPGTKKRKTAELSPLTLPSKACAVGGTQQAATDDTIACRPGVTGYAGGKISACCLSNGFYSDDDDDDDVLMLTAIRTTYQ